MAQTGEALPLLELDFIPDEMGSDKIYRVDGFAFTIALAKKKYPSPSN